MDPQHPKKQSTWDQPVPTVLLVPQQGTKGSQKLSALLPRAALWGSRIWLQKNSPKENKRGEIKKSVACLRTPAPLRVYEPTKDIAWLLGPDAVPLLVQLRGVLHGHNAHRVRDTAAGSPAPCSCSTAPTGALSNCSAAKPRAFFSPPNAHFFVSQVFLWQALTSSRQQCSPLRDWHRSHLVPGQAHTA